MFLNRVLRLLAGAIFASILITGLSACKEPAQTAVPKLIKQLKSKDAHERNVAARTLAAYGDDARKAVRPLQGALWDDNMGVRTSAAYALRKIGTKRALRVLDNYQAEKDRQNRERGEQ